MYICRYIHTYVYVYYLSAYWTYAFSNPYHLAEVWFTSLAHTDFLESFMHLEYGQFWVHQRSVYSANGVVCRLHALGSHKPSHSGLLSHSAVRSGNSAGRESALRVVLSFDSYFCSSLEIVTFWIIRYYCMRHYGCSYLVIWMWERFDI